MRAARFCLLCMMVFVLAGPRSASADSFDEAIDKAQAATVKLFGAGVGLIEGYGSGVLVSADGKVVTTLSLMLQARNLRAQTFDGREFRAEVLYKDTENQLALLQLEPRNATAAGDARGDAAPDEDRARVEQEGLKLDYLVPAESQSLRPGQWLIAAGNPHKVAEGDEAVSISRGVFSGRGRLDGRRRKQPFPYHGPILIIDAITSNPGAPGGPLLDIDGRWIGLIGRDVTSNMTNAHLNYALPIETVVDFLAAAESGDGGKTAATPKASSGPAYHGIKLFDLGYKRQLVYVDRVRPGSPAALAGVKSDDLIVSANGRPVAKAETFAQLVSELSPGDKLELTLKRGNDFVHAEITLGAQP